MTIYRKSKGNYEHHEEVEIFTKKYTSNVGGRASITCSGQTYFGKPDAPPKKKNPKIVNMQFLDENGKILNNENIQTLGDICATNIIYGKKIKIKFFTKGVKDGTKIEFKLHGTSKDNCQDFEQIDKKNWNLEIKNNTCETELFTLNTLWYSENFEFYNYSKHTTEIKAEDLNSFSIKGKLEFIPFELPENPEENLKPIAYLRNYEELIGLFNTDNSGNKALIDNYENKFVNYYPEIFKISREFSEYLNYSENLTLSNIKARVTTDAKKLWETAVKQVQDGLLDDRPMYWARNKMQVALKRNFLFEKDINFGTSIVNKNSELEKIIQIFEEQSRNYDGVDFSKANGKKKLLITGFDPFVLNDDPNMPNNIRFGNPLQSNPSGINALALQGKTIGDFFIQTLICPVRYKDFDEFRNGEGIIETFIQPFIKEVDMIITVSQGDVFRFDIDRFPCKNRGGFMDNMLWGNQKAEYNSKYFKQLTEGKEFYETTLPYQKIVPAKNNPSDTFWVYFNQTFITNGKSYLNSKIEGTKKIEGISDGTVQNNCIVNSFEEIQSLKSISGSGGDYLSNEIFYRVAKLRTEQKLTLSTGHLHIPLTQSKSLLKQYNNLEDANKKYYQTLYHNISKLTIDINPTTDELITKIKEIIIKL